MSAIEKDLEQLREAMQALAERVRIDAVAEEFLTGAVEWRAGDCFLLHGDVRRIDNIASDGDWACGRYEASPRCWEGAERLYSRAEVAEIVAKAVRR